VLIGYIHGVAVVLIVGQLGKLLGLDIDAQDPLAQLAEVVGELDDLSGATVAVGIACLAPLLLLRWRAPKIPGPLLVVVLAIAASAAIGLAEEGVAVVGEIPPGLPGIQFPGLDRTDVLALLPAALGAVIVAAAIGLVDPPAWRGLARTSRVEVAIAAATMAGVIAVGVLEALLVAVALSIVDVVRRSATPHDAVLGWVDRQGRYADVQLHPRARVVPGVLVYRLDDRLFFANASYVKGRIREAIHGAPAPLQWLVFDAEALTHVDATGVEVLTELVRSLRAEHITFVFARLKGPMRQDLQDAGVLDLVGEERLYPTVRAAVQAAAAPPRPGESARPDERVDRQGESDPA
jgi:MFS superfamily sulfate permease-like transporter